MSKYKLGLVIPINESFYDNAIMALKKLVYSVKECDAQDKDDAIKTITFDNYGICSVAADVPKLYNIKHKYDYAPALLRCDRTKDCELIFNTLSNYIFNKYIESGIDGSNIIKFSDICIDPKQENGCEVHETNDKVHILFIIPENLDNVNIYKELVYTDCWNYYVDESSKLKRVIKYGNANNNPIEYVGKGLRNINVEKYGLEHNGGNITISILKLSIYKYLDEDIRLYGLKLIYEDCDYVKMFQEPKEGLIDLIRLIDTIKTNDIVYTYQGLFNDYNRSWIMSKNAANFAVTNVYRRLKLRIYVCNVKCTNVELADVSMTDSHFERRRKTEQLQNAYQKYKESIAFERNRRRDISFTLYPFDLGIVVPLEVKNIGDIKPDNDDPTEPDYEEHSKYIDSIIRIIHTVINGLFSELLNEYSNKLQDEVKTMGQLDLSAIRDLIKNKLSIDIDITDKRIKQIYETNKSNTDAVITEIIEYIDYINTYNDIFQVDKWRDKIDAIDTNIVISFVTSYYFDYRSLRKLQQVLAYLSGNVVTVYECNKLSYVIGTDPEGTDCKSKLFIEFIYIGDDCSYKSELAVGLMALKHKCKFIANYDMYSSTAVPLADMLKAICANSDASVIRLRSCDKYADNSYIISSKILKSPLTVSNDYVLKSNLGIDVLDKAKEYVSNHLLYITDNEFEQKDTLIVTETQKYISITKGTQKVQGGYERINPVFILLILLISALIIYIIVMICNACKNNELFTASNKQSIAGKQ